MTHLRQGYGGQATELGIILGTAAYMAPEQAKGLATDRRADVWAFGVVLYEMLTGKRLFGRPELAETLAAVLTSNPDLTALPASTPPAVPRLIARCLARDKRQRLDSMAVVRLELDEVHNNLRAVAPSSSSYRMPIVAAAVVGGVFALGWFTSRLMDSRSIAPVSSETVISEIAAPPEVISAFHNGFALSPDGQTLVFTARLPNGVRQLWSRSIGSATARPIAGTEDGTYPFWSPDGRNVAFFTENRLKRVPIAGGQVQTICQAVGFRSGSWSVRDEIVFGGLFVVSASGGTPRKLEALGAGLRPRWFADGRRFVYRGQDTLGIGAADGSPPKMIKGTSAQDYELAPGGHLLMNKDDVLIAQRIDEDTGALVGPAVTIAGEAARPNNWMALSSRADRLIGYVRQSGDVGGDLGAPWATLEWVARDGTRVGTIGARARYWAHEISPDGRRVAISASGSWILDGVRRLRLPGYQPIWSPDGRQFIYRQPTGQIFLKHVDSDEPGATLDGVSGLIVDWSRDGRWLTVDGHWGDQATGQDISLYDFQGRTFKSWLSTEFNESSARFSPDGRWMAYVSDANGQRDVYIRRVDGSGSPISVSTGGGIHPRWRRDGRELFFLGLGDAMTAVDLTLGTETVVVGTPKKLFTVPLNDISIGFRPPYDVTADGQRFLLNVPDRPEPLFFVQGLEALIRKGGR